MRAFCSVPTKVGKIFDRKIIVVYKSFRCICQLHFFHDHHHSSSLQVNQVFHSPRVMLEYIRVSHSVIRFWEMLTKQFYSTRLQVCSSLGCSECILMGRNAKNPACVLILRCMLKNPRWLQLIHSPPTTAFLATTYLEYFARIMAWESTFVDAPKLTKKLSC